MVASLVPGRVVKGGGERGRKVEYCKAFDILLLLRTTAGPARNHKFSGCELCRQRSIPRCALHHDDIIYGPGTLDFFLSLTLASPS